jgi:hypothetical protein
MGVAAEGELEGREPKQKPLELRGRRSPCTRRTFEKASVLTAPNL